MSLNDISMSKIFQVTTLKFLFSFIVIEFLTIDDFNYKSSILFFILFLNLVNSSLFLITRSFYSFTLKLYDLGVTITYNFQ